MKSGAGHSLYQTSGALPLPLAAPTMLVVATDVINIKGPKIHAYGRAQQPCTTVGGHLWQLATPPVILQNPQSDSLLSPV